MQLWHFDNFDNQLGVINRPSSCIFSFTVSEQHSLSFACKEPVEKEDRIVFRDNTGEWRESIVADAVEDDADGRPLYRVTGIDSIDELSGDYHVDRRASGTATVLLRALLENSRWEVGTVNVAGSGKCNWYHQSAIEALGELCKLLGCEWSTTIIVEHDRVTHRLVNLLTRLGTDRGNRFEYRRNLQGVTRSRGQNKIYTRVYGYGKGEEVSQNEDGSSNYGRKITFGDVNGGKDYVESDEARQRWGRPDGHGGKAHVTGKVEFDDCTDKAELLKLTEEWAENQYSPQMSYTAKVIDLSRGGFSPDAVGIGDDVAIIDATFDPPIRIKGRVMAGKVNLLSPEPDGDTYTIGNLRDTLGKNIVDQDKRIKRLTDRSGEWDAAVSRPLPWLDELVQKLNEQFNAGGSYKHESFENGTIYASVPLDKNGKPTKTPATAFQLTGQGFRIASEVNERGEFEWRTFGTGDGFTADEINAGVIRGGSAFWNLETGEVLFKSGGIYDLAGMNFWNLTTGEAQFASTTKIGDKTVEEIAEGAVESQTQDDVFNKLTNGGENQGLYIHDGVLYLNGTYIKTGKITDGVGKNYWDLVSGDFMLSPTGVKVGSQTLDSYVASKNTDTFATANATNVFNKLTNNGAVKGITMSNNRLYINADYINTGTFSVNDLFSANKTQGKVTIAGFTVAANEMQGDYVKIGHKAITIQSENQNLDIGDLTASYSGNATGSSNVDRWICLAVNNQALASGIAFTIKDNPDNKYSMVANYAKSKQSTENVTVGSWNFYKNIDMHGNRIHNAVVTSANAMAIGNSIGDEISFLAPTKINDDGTIAEYSEVKLGYTNGILTKMVKPEA